MEVVVLIVMLLVLGPKRLPAAGESLGEGIRNSKIGLTTGEDEAAESPVEERVG